MCLGRKHPSPVPCNHLECQTGSQRFPRLHVMEQGVRGRGRRYGWSKAAKRRNVPSHKVRSHWQGIKGPGTAGVWMKLNIAPRKSYMSTQRAPHQTEETKSISPPPPAHLLFLSLNILQGIFLRKERERK